MNYRYVIDRVENNQVVIQKENGDIYEIPIESIKGNFKEGDILVQEGKCFKVNEKFTNDRKNIIDHIMKDMWQ